MHIYDYLCRESRRMTDRAPLGLDDGRPWEEGRAARVRQYSNVLGLTPWLEVSERPPLDVTVTGRFERATYRVENLHFQSLPRLHVSGNLYLPKAPEGERRPAVLYLCGHHPRMKFHYQAHPRRFAELGFVCLVIDTIQYGEVFGTHGGTMREGQWQWYSRGYNPAGVETWNAIRALDLLEARPEVDGNALGSTGISGGGSVSYWLGAVDERVKCIASVCCTGTKAHHIAERTMEGHCDCVLYETPHLWDEVDINALIAPRPVFIGSANRDILFSQAAFREHYERLHQVYEHLGVPENLVLLETPGPHSYQESSRKAIFAWFLKHLMGREVPAEEIDDIDESADEPDDVLRVFVDGPPPDDISTTIQDTFVRVAERPEIADEADLRQQRDALVANLMTHTFAAFPPAPPALDFVAQRAWETPFRRGFRFHFQSEDGWRAPGDFSYSPEAEGAAATILYLGRDFSICYPDGFLTGIPDSYHRAHLEPRGRHSTSWGPDLDWLVRRASAFAGRTVASLRVWDTLRALAALRALEAVDGNRMALAAEGEMALVALYAALLDGNIRSIILKDPPATQNAPGHPLGHAPFLDMLHVLRYTDAPWVAGLLYPAELVFLGNRPETYGWAEDLYARLGGRVRHIKSMEEWKPSD